MIVRITGILAAVNDDAIILDRDGVCYEVFIPKSAAGALTGRLGQTITLHTIEYYEGSAMGGNIYPRLVGFLDEGDRSFFTEFIKVKGMGYRKALKACAQPVKQIASAIERGDVRMLATLPEIGKRTAEQLVASLRGKLNRFTWASGETGGPQEPGDNFNQIQQEALEVLVQLGERRNEAAELIEKVCRVNPEIKDPAKIVEAVYRRKSGMI
jgi:holliday junction DNA helicase RuvA